MTEPLSALTGAADAAADYHHENPTRHTLADCYAAVGKRFELTLTGVVDGVDVSEAGPFVRLTVDERWGFGEFSFGIDLDPVVVAPDAVSGALPPSVSVSEEDGCGCAYEDVPDGSVTRRRWFHEPECLGRVSEEDA